MLLYFKGDVAHQKRLPEEDVSRPLFSFGEYPYVEVWRFYHMFALCIEGYHIVHTISRQEKGGQHNQESPSLYIPPLFSFLNATR